MQMYYVYDGVTSICSVLLSWGHSVVSGQWSESLHHKRRRRRPACYLLVTPLTDRLTTWPLDHPQSVASINVIWPHASAENTAIASFNGRISERCVEYSYFEYEYDYYIFVVSSRILSATFQTTHGWWTSCRYSIWVNNENTRRGQTTARANPMNLPYLTIGIVWWLGLYIAPDPLHF